MARVLAEASYMPPEASRVYSFASWIELNGERGPACIERMAAPPKKCPDASTRIIVRWEGRVKAGTRIKTSAGDMQVLRFFQMTTAQRVAHILCLPARPELS